MIELPIYLDNAATTPVDSSVLDAMLPYFSRAYGNPSAIYSLGAEAREAVERAREIVADALNASPEEIVFTSGGTESDNAAILGAAMARRSRGRHILTTAIEHRAVLEPMERLRSQGFEVETLPIDNEGRVDPTSVAERLRSDTILVSVMSANNEIGTIEPIAEIGAVCRDRGTLLHTDAVQMFGKLPIDVRRMGVGLLSLSAHKLNGPKGVGALYVRRGVKLERFMTGGEQEGGRRAGTTNTPGVVGLGEATAIAVRTMEAEATRQSALRDRLIGELERRVPGTRLMGSRLGRMPGSVHVCFEGVAGEPLLLGLDEAGICASAGSACSAGSVEPSHVLLAIGVPVDLARGGLRLTFGRATTWDELEYTLNVLVGLVGSLRALGGGSVCAVPSLATTG